MRIERGAVGAGGVALGATLATLWATAAGAVNHLPFGFGSSSSVIVAEGYVMAPGESVISPSHITVTPGYFQALSLPLRRGRAMPGNGQAHGLPQGCFPRPGGPSS